MLVLVDPQAPDDLVERMGEWGIELADDVIVDRTLALFGRAMTPFAGSYDPVHEITRDLREPTLFHEARSVSGRAGADAEFTEIVLTSDSSWAERDLQMLYREGKVSPGDEDLMGPVPLAVAGRPAIVSGNGDGPEAAEDEGEAEEASEPRVVVIGDADFASNEFVESYRNRDLFVNSVNWLIGDVEAISVRPNRSRASRFQLTNEQFHSIRSLSLFVLPEAIAVIGVFVWWTRRHPTR